MEEDAGGRVTRLRRRLSVEQIEDIKSPSAPSTPTKKRVGRLAAKPQLDNIDENATVSSSKRPIRKSIARDVVEPSDERALTPSRRNTRVRSNTSITSEISQSCGSPRALRAARRSSFAGSDTEGPATPLRQTRRTRKDSSSSLENQSELISKPSKNIPETPILEETISEKQENKENDNENSDSNKFNNVSPTTVRKSPRLMVKMGNKIGNNDTQPKNPRIVISPINLKTIKKSDTTKTSPGQALYKKSSMDNIDQSDLDNVSVLNRKKNNLNKSAPVKLETPKSKMNKRLRSKSLTNFNINSHKDQAIFLSDNENVNVNTMKSKKSFGCKSFELLGSGDNQDQSSKNVENKEKNNDEKEHLVLTNSTKKSNKKNGDTFNNGINNHSFSKTLKTSHNREVMSSKTDPNITASKENMEIVTYLDEPDFITETTDKVQTSFKIVENEDQCVPVVVQKVNDDIVTKDCFNVDVSCEPMDVDETIPEDILVNELDIKNNTRNKNLSTGIDPNISQNNQLLSTSLVKSNKTLSDSKNSSYDTIKQSKCLSHIVDEDIGNEGLVVSSVSHITVTSYGENVNKSLLKKTCSVSLINDLDKKEEKRSSLNNLSENTPLKHKNMSKFGMTSTPNIEKQEINVENILIDKNANSESESSDDSKTQGVGEFLTMEAEDAGDDYESGDSQDEDEREYERQNEIAEKGETLSFEDEEISNNSDYEKDSFIVSSDEEDNGLLSGSGDDLALSDNELTMSAKSKNKYNDRKNKEQKLASREMYEARHNLNQGKNKSRKINQPKIDSTTDTSSEEEINIPKRNKRQRIDSTLEASLVDEEINKPKKKTRMRLDSTLETNTSKLNQTCENSSKCDTFVQLGSTHDLDQTNTAQDSYAIQKNKANKGSTDSINKYSETDITIVEDVSILKKKDPLSTSLQIKHEPKTPQKGIDISTINFTVREEIETVEVKNNISLPNQNDTVDPLLDHSSHSDASSSSDNQEIIQNYDSVLNDLNNLQTKNLNIGCNVSLNLDKKSKQKYNKEPIIDQLNISQTKTPSKNKNKHAIKNNLESEKESSYDFSQQKVQSQKKCKDASALVMKCDSSSDSIDLKLLFSGESESDDSEKRNFSKKDVTVSKDEGYNPLKKSEGKSNILDDIGDISTSKINESSSKKKKNKRKTSECQSESTAQETEITGKNVSTTLADTSIKEKKKKRKTSERQSEDLVPETEITEENVSTTLADTSIKEKKKKRKTSENFVPETEITEENVSTTLAETSIKEKKKERKTSEHQSENLVPETEITEENVSTTLAETSIKEKKKERKTSEHQSENLVPETEITEENVSTALVETSIKKKKEKRKTSEHQSENLLPATEITDKSSTTDLNESSGKKKKNKRKTSERQSESSAPETEITDKILTESLNESSGKKKKSKRKTSDRQNESSVPGAPMVESEQQGHKHSSSKVSMEDHTDLIHLGEPSSSTQQDNKMSKHSNANKQEDSRKRKRKPSNEVANRNIELEVQSGSGKDTSLTAGSLKKKQKLSEQRDGQNLEARALENVILSHAEKNRDNKMTKKAKDKSQEIEAGDFNSDKNKKRKRDKEDVLVQKKVFKGDKVEDIQIRRLPSSVIDLLEDGVSEPKRVSKHHKRAKVVSTTDFCVEDTRIAKYKPSKYLEESVHIDSEECTKLKLKKPKPKLLPFIPVASTSSYGFTTNFQVNVIPKVTQFVAQSEQVPNFRNDYLYGKRIRRMGTYEQYKKHRNVKSKF